MEAQRISERVKQLVSVQIGQKKSEEVSCLSLLIL